MNLKWRLIVLFTFITLQNRANVSLPCFFSDGMVLQRNLPIPIWGWAEPNEMVAVSFKGKNYQTKADLNRQWKIFLPAQGHGGPFEMHIQASNKIVIQNVLVGEVWFCSGQSNMEYELYKSDELYSNEIKTADNPNIHLFQVKRNFSFLPVKDLMTENGWEMASPKSVLKFSAVAYLFGRKLYEKYKVPIGMINCSYGGTPAEAWMSEAALEAFPHYLKRAEEFKNQPLVDSIGLRDKRIADRWNDELNAKDLGEKEDWKSNNTSTADWKLISIPSFWQDSVYPEVKAGILWLKKEVYLPKKYTNIDGLLRLGNLSLKDVTFVNGVKVGSTNNKYLPRKYKISAQLLKEGGNTITVKLQNESGDAGFIRDKPYRLEIGDTTIELTGSWRSKMAANAEPLDRTEMLKLHTEATSLYNGMVQPIVGYGIRGMLWYQGESNIHKSKEYYSLFPALIKSWRKEWGQGDFPFLYVQLANINKPKSKPSESKLAELQDAQAQALSLPNTGMAVANDLGEWNDVHPMNKMDVAHRLFLSSLKIAYGEKNTVHAGPALASYQLKKDTVILSFYNSGSGLLAKNDTKLNHFALADASGKYVWANAFINGQQVYVSSPFIKSPVYLRYAWADNPVGANLYNKEGLPASCFTIEIKQNEK